MDSTDSITFTSKLTFWDKFKCFYLLDFYSRISLYNAKKWQRILGHLIYILFWIIIPIAIFLETNIGLKLFDIFCLLSFFWIPAITAFKVVRNIPDNVQLILTPGNATETSDTPSLKVRYSDTKIDCFKNAILFDTPNFYIIICYNNAVDKKMRLIYNIISKKQNNDILAKFNFVKTISPDLKKIIKLHI
ncbi:hypothetical protein [Lactobacillus delbrueckii]|jgi:hypothetical protein|uniref:YcxB-like protein domain-containing protein n=1 Tax=Lactobacillus delbrueckii TaxID=1584 RepID=A0ABD4W143_9LACO|nr:hypothetical protein [Lactobacillus delbrueckii]MBN6090455.1 hypothetical protein [Lactobacillus delbrueckii subsp. bulgaricus]MDA3777465.1 hypothetical protein [Lactobacillus delbrueckii]MDA3782321.1 hypothetical protein [Lactobacillus delbrueckii]MDA3794315.1 hypothetical protein [Lactobacillus delbrueckii]MDA3841524.1 hypothetical protein [Lactobacillus delbrueckii]